MGVGPIACTSMGVQDGREPMHSRQSMRWMLGVLEMSSEDEDYMTDEWIKRKWKQNRESTKSNLSSLSKKALLALEAYAKAGEEE